MSERVNVSVSVCVASILPRTKSNTGNSEQLNRNIILLTGTSQATNREDKKPHQHTFVEAEADCRLCAQLNDGTSSLFLFFSIFSISSLSLFLYHTQFTLEDIIFKIAPAISQSPSLLVLSDGE